MADIVARGCSEDLVWRAKGAAFAARVTLREWLIEAVEEKLNGKSKAVAGKPDKVASADTVDGKRTGGADSNRGRGAVRSVARRASVEVAVPAAASGDSKAVELKPRSLGVSRGAPKCDRCDRPLTEWGAQTLRCQRCGINYPRQA